MNDTLPSVFCAIDTIDTARAVKLANDMARAGCGLKLGLEFFNAQGPHGIHEVMESQNGTAARTPLFLDLKFHDIPNTVAGAVRAATVLQPAYLNVHASGGREMMKQALAAAHDSAAALNITAPRLLAVTILTSLDDAALAETGFARGSRDTVLRLANLTQEAGLAGIVCSAHEIEAVRGECGPDFILMVPGIRPAGSDAGDQKRVMTPAEALARGATHLVIGRPITGADDPEAAARAILADLPR